MSACLHDRGHNRADHGDDAAILDFAMRCASCGELVIRLKRDQPWNRKGVDQTNRKKQLPWMARHKQRVKRLDDRRDHLLPILR